MPTSLKWKLLGLFFLGLVLFNFPILELFALKKLIFGIPSLLFYLLVIWLVYILILRSIVDSPNEKKRNKHS